MKAKKESSVASEDVKVNTEYTSIQSIEQGERAI